jgi:O-antigen/teichoic acid export membrane protein
MLVRLTEQIRNFISSGNKRSVKAKKNIFASVFIRGFSVTINFLLVRVSLEYLDETRYGIWLTIASFLYWFNFFDLGLEKGLRNRLAETLALKKYKLARIYISSSYAMLTMIIGMVSLIFFTANLFLDWAKILNAPAGLSHQLNIISVLVFGSFFIRFILKIIGSVLNADQRPALYNLLNPLGNFISLIILVLLLFFANDSLLYLSIVMCSSPVIILLISTILLYSRKYHYIRPSIAYVKLKSIRSILNLGLKFFVINISYIIIYQTSNIIIARAFSPADVTPYNLAFRYFNLLIVFFQIVLIPYWSAITEAWTTKDYRWIENIMKRLQQLWYLVIILALFMLFTAKFAYKILYGDINIPFKLSVYFCIYFVLFILGNIYSTFLNGTGKIKLQLYLSSIGAIIFLPLTLFFLKVLHLGVESVILAIIISNFFGPIVAPIQYKKLITNTAKNIWNK